jgi:hypothetical protein
MKPSPSPSFESPWVPKKIAGNTAYYYNTDTGETKSEFVPNNKISERKKEFADWFKINSKFRKRTASGKFVMIPKKNYEKLSRDPLAAFDYQHISKREGVVTQVLSANRLVIDGNYIVQVPGIVIPAKRTHPEAWLKAKAFTESLVQGKRVYLGVNTNNPYNENGDILASVDFEQQLPNQQDTGEWGVFDYLNISGYAVGAVARNISQGGIVGKASIGDRYSLSDTFTFTRAYHQLIGDAKTLGAISKGETEGEWYEKLAIDIVGDPLNFVSIEGKGISLAGRRIVKGARYMRPISLLKSKSVAWANQFESHVALRGAGETIDTVNRTWRRVNLLLEPAFYTANAQLDFWNSMLAGINPARYLNIDPIIKGAKNPTIRNMVALKVAGKPGGGYTYKEIAAFMKEYHLGESSIGDIHNPYAKKGIWDPLLSVVNWQSARTQGALFIDGLKKGMDPAVAAERVHHFLPYDPRYLTAFERAYINRLYPFYTPASRNLYLQAEQLLKTPYKYTTIAKWQVQQRRFAGDDQFKDYQSNTIIQKVGEGKYVKLRFPTEDLTQLPSKYKNWQSALSNSLYPVYTLFPELYMDRNLFDNTRPKYDMPKYLMKKFVSREYYAYRDWNNPNMPLSEKISKHVFGVGVITPDNRMSYKQTMMDLGFSPTEAMQDAEIEFRRHKTFQANSLRAVQKAQLQAASPEERRDRPNDLEIGWETFQYLQYASMAGLVNVAALVQTGRMGNKGIIDRIKPSDLIKTIDQQYFGGKAAGYFPAGGIFALSMTPEQRRQGLYLAADLVVDPLNFLTWTGKVGKMIIVDGKVLTLSKEGRSVFAKMNPVVESGRAEGLYGKQAAMRMEIEANIKMTEYLKLNPGLAGKLARTPGLSFLGKTIINTQRANSITNPLKVAMTTSIKIIASKISKEVSTVMSPLKKYVAERMGASEALRIKWKDDFQKGYDIWLTNVKQLKKVSADEIKHLESQTNIKLGVWTTAKRKHAADPSHGFFYHLSLASQETATKLTDYLELGKANPSAQGVVDDVAKRFETMANEEIPRGLLKATRQNYVSHIVLSKYKFLQGYTDPILSKFHIKTPFAMHRAHDATIADFNAQVKAKYNVEVFEPNIWKILKIRKNQHIEAVETYDFLRRLAEEQGINKVWAPFLKNTYGVSKIPTVSDVLLPIETITNLERIPIFRSHISTLHTKPGIFKRMIDNYDGLTSLYKRNIIFFNPSFVPRNTVSSVHQSIMAGYYGGYKLRGLNIFGHEFIKPNPTGLAYVTNDGRRVYNWERNQWYQDYKVTNQPGMAVAATVESKNAMDKFGAIPRWLTVGVEDIIRTTLHDAKVIEGMTPEQAGKYVMAHHLDYMKQYGPGMKWFSRFIMFPTWVLGAPIMVARSMVERPWQFSLTSKAIDAWNNPTDKIMLKYAPESMNSKMMFKIPGTEDAFFSPPFATGELMQYPVILRTKEFQFYWQEALNNPNTLKRFARNNLEIDWLSRGGGTAKKDGEDIIITYQTTGETLRAHISSRNTLVFTDGNTGIVVKEFDTRGKGNRIEIVRDNEPLNNLARRYLYPFFSIPLNAVTDSKKYKMQSTGNPLADALDLVVQLSGFGAIKQDIQDYTDEDKPLWSYWVGIVGQVWFAHEGMGMEREPSKEKVKRARETLYTNYRGCGF